MPDENIERTMDIHEVIVVDKIYVYIYLDNKLKVMQVADKRLSPDEIIGMAKYFNVVNITVDHEDIYSILRHLQTRRFVPFNKVEFITDPILEHFITKDTMLNPVFIVDKRYSGKIKVYDNLKDTLVCSCSKSKSVGTKELPRFLLPQIEATIALSKMYGNKTND